MVDIAVKTGNMNLIEAESVIQANDQFHKISDTVREEVGSLDSERIFFEWNEWFKRQIKRDEIRQKGE